MTIDDYEKYDPSRQVVVDIKVDEDVENGETEPTADQCTSFHEIEWVKGSIQIKNGIKVDNWLLIRMSPQSIE